MVLIADSILARSTRRRQTSTGWNTAYIGANRYTLPGEKPLPVIVSAVPPRFEPLLGLTFVTVGAP